MIAADPHAAHAFAVGGAVVLCVAFAMLGLNVLARWSILGRRRPERRR